MGQARYGAASEVGFAKAEYDEYGNRAGLSGNQKAGIAGVGIAGTGATLAVRSGNMPIKAAEQLRYAEVTRNAAQKELQAARQRRAAASSRRGIRRADAAIRSADVRLAGEHQNVNIFRQNLASIGNRQKSVRAGGLGMAATGAALAGAAMWNSRRNRSAQ